jgi:hypothetical protein
LAALKPLKTARRAGASFFYVDILFFVVFFSAFFAFFCVFLSAVLFQASVFRGSVPLFSSCFGRFRVVDGTVFSRRVVDATAGSAKSASDGAAFYGRRDFLRRAGFDAKSESRRFTGNAASRLGIYFRFFGNF